MVLAYANETSDKATKCSVKVVGGKVAVLPISLFFVTFVLVAMCLDQSAILALMAPSVMILAEETGIPSLLMALMVGNGGQAGAKSPIAHTGLADGLVSKIGLP